MINSDEITGDIRAEHNLREPQILINIPNSSFYIMAFWCDK